MSENSLTHYCIACGEPFHTTDPKKVLCPACGGEPEAALGTTADLTQTVAPPLPSKEDFLPPSPGEVAASSVGGEALPPLPSGKGWDEGFPPLPQGEGPGVRSDWQVGKLILDTYEVKGELGQGGFGKVYRVHHKSWNIDLAVKRSLKIEPESRQAFIEEAEKWVDLGLHPNIVSCYYVRTIDDFHHTFAELAEGGSLEKWIRTGKLYEGQRMDSLKRILDVAIQFAWGLAYAHERGLVHQDVKPDNVLMGAGEVAKVTDFGLARARTRAGVAGPSGAVGDGSVSAVGGTVAYMSPEQSAGQRLTPKTDLWSWGVSVLEMLLGERTWMSGVAALDVLEDYAAPGSELAAGAKIASPPAQLVEILRQCFSYEPVQRPADMLEVAGRLQEIYRQEVGQAYPRQLPKAAELRADSLNNKALSMMDLGKEQDAVDAWRRALEIDPHHAEASYNLGSWRWQAAQQTDLDLVHQLEAVIRTQAGAWIPKYLLGLVHMRRQDIPAARQVLEEAARIAPAEENLGAEIRRLDQIPPVGCLRSLTGHTGSVNAVAFLPDGHRCLSGGDDCNLQLWNLDSGKQSQTFEGHTESVTHIAITLDGKKAVSGGWDHTLRVWDLSGGDCLSVLEGGLFDPVNTIIVQRGGHRVTSISGSVLQVWNLDTGAPLERLNVLDGDGIGSHTILPDERRMISGTLDCSLCIWDLANGECRTTLKGHKERISAVAITPDGQRAVSAGHNYTNQDRSLRVWDLNTGMCQGFLQGHSDEAYAIVIAPNGKQVISAGRDRTLRVWDLASGRCLRTLEGHANSVFDLALSSDGLKIVSASADKTLRVWQLNPLDQVPVQWALNRPATSQDVQKGAAQVRQVLATAEAELNANNVTVAASLLRQALLISGFERDSAILDLWHTAGRKAGKPVGLREVHLQQTLQAHSSRVHIVTATPDRQQIISGSWDNTLRIWDLDTGQCLRVLEGHKQNIHSLVISRDGRFAVSGSEDKTIKVWDLPAGRCLHTLQGHDSWVKSVALTSDGLRVLSGSGDKTLRLWDMHSGACLQVLEGHTHYVEAVAVSPEGSLAVSGGFDHTLRVWDLRNGKCLRILQGHDNLMNAVLFTPDGRQLISAGSFDKTLRVWDLASGKCLHILQGHTAAISSITLTSDGRKAISCSEDGSLRVWDLQSGQCLWTLTGHTGKVRSAAVTPDGRWAVSCSTDMTLRLWDLSTGKQVRLFSGHTYVWCGRFSPDGRQIISGSSDRTVHLWNVETGREVRCYKGHTDVVTSVCFSSDARYILSGSYDRTLRLWEVATGNEVKRFTGHSEFVTSVCFSPDDHYALSSSKDRTIRLWEISTGKLLSTYQAHTDFISSVDYSPDGRFILFCSADSTLRLLEAKTWREIRRFEGHNQFARSVRFSPDGRYAVSTSLDGTLRFWEMYYPAKDYARSHPYPLLSKIRTFGRLADDRNLADEYTREAENLIREGAYPKAYNVLQKAQGIPGYERQEKLLKLVAECATLGGARRRGLRDYWEVRTLAGHTDFIYAVSITPDSRTIISGGRDQTIRIWDLTNGQEVRCLKGHESIVLSVDVSADGKTFLSGARDGTMRQWEAATGREIQRYRHNNVVFSVGYIPDSLQALSGCADRYMRLWDLATNKELARYKHSNNVIGVCGLPGGRLALSSCSDNNLYLWDLAAGRQVSAFKGHTDRINSVSVSPDGCYALSGSEDKTIRLWELKRGTEVKQFLGHSASVRTVRFSPDGLYALSGSNDKSICLWEIESGAQIKKAEGHTDLVNTVFVSRDGRYAVSGSADRTLHLWEFDWKWIFSGQGLG